MIACRGQFLTSMLWVLHDTCVYSLPAVKKDVVFCFLFHGLPHKIHTSAHNSQATPARRSAPIFLVFNIDACRGKLPGLEFGHLHRVQPIVEHIQVASACCDVFRVHSSRDASPAPTAEALNDRVINLDVVE